MCCGYQRKERCSWQNGEGNIRKRADGRWEGRYTAGYHPETGKRIIKNVLGKTQAECKAKLKKAIEESQALDISRANDGQFHGTDSISPTGKQSTGKETVSSPVLFGSFRTFRCVGHGVGQSHGHRRCGVVSDDVETAAHFAGNRRRGYGFARFCDTVSVNKRKGGE